MASLLQIEDLHTEIRLRRATVHALDGVSLTVEAGECLGIVGESGSGKTMTALSIMQLLPPGGHIVGGQITLDGQEISALDDDGMRRVRGNEIGMIFQDPMTSLNPTMTIGDQIAETVLLHRGADAKTARARAIEVLGLVGMPRPAERVGNYPHQLSGGMRQRVMIAMALACEPKLLIADEPTTALDVTIQKQILELIDDLRQRLGMAVILVTHDLGVIAGRADRAAVMYAGRVVETTSTTRLFANPRHPYTEALFGALPEKAADESERLYSIPGMPPDLTAPPAGCKFAARCRYVQDSCKQDEPSLDGDTWGHLFRCYFPVGRAESDEPADQAARLTVTDSARARRVQVGMEERETALLTAGHLVKNFAVTAGAVLQRKVGEVSAVADVSFAIRPGRTFGMVGESGCGKTTVGRLIAGLERANSGSIMLDGEDIVRLARHGLSDPSPLSNRERRRRSPKVQLMFQDSYASMDPRMRVGPILREPLAIQGIGSRQEQHKQIAAILDEVGLPQAAVDRYPHEFSGGQRQRLGLARALILRPKLVVADEPVSALDVSIQAQILNLMLDLQRDLGLTYLFISHDLSVVRYLSDTIGVMYLGKMVEMGPADDVYYRPVHPYTRGLIDTVPVADPALAQAREDKGVAGELPSAVNPPSGCRFRTRCPRAQDICASEEPPLRPFTAEGHVAACHFPLREPEGVTPVAATP
ncbi:MAG TPA: ABC transporter ATP-binding protein [Streptosporangiaceae bacterium]|nr:ABC transporter ATP-binding protein [Streptosporangiaceae bacterium]